MVIMHGSLFLLYIIAYQIFIEFISIQRMRSTFLDSYYTGDFSLVFNLKEMPSL